MTEPKAFGADLPPWPLVDYAAFGPIDVKPLPRIRKIASGFMARNWVSIPHVTHHDDADVTDLEALRQTRNRDAPVTKLTLLPYLIKASVAALRAHPQFNASLDLANNSIVYKQYFHIGVAVDTPNGLLVPVLKNCEQRGVAELAREIATVSDKARTKGLSLADMSGGCFSISVLGGIGGTGFTPIINAPEVAILGVSRARWQPTRGEADAIVWRLLLPLSLSYDHRWINGADAARFVRSLAEALGNPASLEV